MEGHSPSRVQTMRCSGVDDFITHPEPSSPILSFINDKLMLSSEAGELMEKVVNNIEA